MLMMVVFGWLVWAISRICISLSSMMSDLRVTVKSGRGLK